MAVIRSETPFLAAIKNALIEVYRRRNLFVDESEIFAIANPEQIHKSEDFLKNYGVLHEGRFSYDFRVQLVISKAADGREFDFFFSLKLLKTPIMEIDQLLDFRH